MKLNKYQADAVSTAGKRLLSCLALGVSGEAGEVADEVKKVVYHGHELDHMKLAKELGDVLWYIAVMSEEIGFTLEEVATINLEKLKARYPNGFSSEKRILNIYIC